MYTYMYIYIYVSSASAISSIESAPRQASTLVRGEPIMQVIGGSGNTGSAVMKPCWQCW